MDALTKIKRLAEMSAEILRDPCRSNGFVKTEKIACRFDDIAELATNNIDYDKSLVLGALDSLACLLTKYNHQWTEGERAIYEQSVAILKS
jgi:hypothetical protein